MNKANIALDLTRRHPVGFVSHAHSDHMAGHDLTLATPETCHFFQRKYNARPVLQMPLRQPMEHGGLRLTAFPAGHCIGSAMLLAESGEQRLLYTGDFKLAESATAVPAELPRADILIMECTFGLPKYRFPPRNVLIDQLLCLVDTITAKGRIPLVEAYSFGKAQEVTKILTSHGKQVRQHPHVFRMSQDCVSLGANLGEFKEYRGDWQPGEVLVFPPKTHRADRWQKIQGAERIMVSGWGMDPYMSRRFAAPHVLPLSDHADFDELLTAVRMVEPKRVYCTHGPDEFAEHVRDLGFQAFALGKSPLQQMLF